VGVNSNIRSNHQNPNTDPRKKWFAEDGLLISTSKRKLLIPLVSTKTIKPARWSVKTAFCQVLFFLSIKFISSADQVTKKMSKSEIDKKRAREIAMGPAKGIPMTAFMMWMSGDGVNIFSMSIVFYTAFNAIKSIIGVNKGGFTFDFFCPLLSYFGSLFSIDKKK
jgi:hypothetical protein